jgi:signal transduction histidine kinase
MESPLRVLIVEDCEADALLLLRELRRGGYAVVHETVQTGPAMRAAIETKTWDLVLSDFSMPEFSAQEALKLVKEKEIDLPFIIVSGTIGEETAVECMRAGARDFVVKDKMARLVPAIARELHEASRRRDQLAERRGAEVERERLLAELREAVQARDTFLAIAAHELRTPLTSLQLTVQSLERANQRGTLATKPVEALASSVDVIGRQVSRLGALVQNLLDVARITGDCLTLSRETVDLAEIAADVVAQSAILGQRSNAEVLLDARPAVGTWDRFRIETVVGNLISNAVKFGDGKPVQISVSSDERMAHLTVADHGSGISLENQARIFGKFERAVPDRHYGGFGLGLWIARQIVEAHGGTIRVASEAGRGSSFFVDLPLREGDAHA